MIVTVLESPLFLPEPVSPRSDGIHISNIIRAIAIESNILQGYDAEDLSLTDYREITDPLTILRMSIGLAWEQYYIPTILSPSLGVIDHPGEMCIEGIFATHDGESISTVIIDRKSILIPTVHEVKATYKSINTVLEVAPDGTFEINDFMWTSQIKAYCQGMGKLRVYRAELHVLFLCGDYSWPIRPVLKRFGLEFSLEEVGDNWSLLSDYVKSKSKKKGKK